MSTEKKVVFITGASSGIGAALAKLFSSKDYRVVLTARSVDKLKALASSLPHPEDALAIPLDIGDAKAAQEVVKSVYEKWGRIDVLINNAGLALGSPKPFHEQTIEDLDAVLRTNLSGALYVTHAVLNTAMLRANDGKGRGDIVNVSSITGLRAPPMGECSYHTSKAGLEGFSNALRHELIGTNVRVLVVRPGFVGGASDFHFVRHGEGHGGEKGQNVFEGLQPLECEDAAEAVWDQVSKPERVSLSAVDVVPTPQRSLYVADREWNQRNGVGGV